MSIVAETATLAHGFTMADVERACRTVASRGHSSPYLSWSDRFDLAWMAIVEEIYASRERPENLTLIGFRALSRASADEQHHHGRSQPGMEAGERSVKFGIYWRPIAGTGDFTEAIVERLALPEVLGELTPLEYEAIATLAAFDGDYQASMLALGVSKNAFHQRIKSGRKRILAAWFSPETPRGPRKRRDGECAYGHDLAEHGYQRPDRPAIICKLCRRNEQRRRGARLGGHTYNQPSVGADA